MNILKWGISEGLIYENWQVEEFDLKEVMKDPSYRLYYGMDFGYNDPTAFVAVAASQKDYRLYVFDEWCESTMENRRIASMIISKGYQNAVITADNEDPRTINELKKLGLWGIRSAKKGRGSVLGGIQKLQDYRIIVNPKCTNMIISLSNYSWERDKETGEIKNVPEHAYSHMCITGDTLIHTINGMKPIKDIKEGELVYSYDIENKKIELQKSYGAYVTGVNQEVYELKLADGQKLHMTGNHKLLTTRGYVPCEELGEDDEVLQELFGIDALRYLLRTGLNKIKSVEKNLSRTSIVKQKLVQSLVGLFTHTVGVKIESIMKLEKKETVYNMTVEKNHNYLIGNNIWAKNCDALRYGCEKLGKLSIEL